MYLITEKFLEIDNILILNAMINHCTCEKPIFNGDGLSAYITKFKFIFISISICKVIEISNSIK